MIKAILKKELDSFFKSPQAFLLAGIFMLVAGWMFFNLLSFFVSNIQQLPQHLRHSHDFSNSVVLKFFGNINFLFMLIIPILSMGSFAEEYKEKTIELYFSSHVSDTKLVIAKFLSVLSQALFLLVLTFVFPLILSNLDFPDISFIYSGYLGLILNLACYTAIGVFASSLGQSSIISAIVSIILIIFVWMTSSLGDMSSNYLVSEVLGYLSLGQHFQNFIKGWLSISDISFYLSFIIVFLYLTKKRIEMRKW